MRFGWVQNDMRRMLEQRHQSIKLFVEPAYFVYRRTSQHQTFPSAMSQFISLDCRRIGYRLHMSASFCLRLLLLK